MNQAQIKILTRTITTKSRLTRVPNGLLLAYAANNGLITNIINNKNPKLKLAVLAGNFLSDLFKVKISGKKCLVIKCKKKFGVKNFDTYQLTSRKSIKHPSDHELLQ